MPKQYLYINSKLDCICNIASLACHSFRGALYQDIKDLVFEITKPFQNSSTVAKNPLGPAKSTGVVPFLHQGLTKPNQKHHIESYA